MSAIVAEWKECSIWHTCLRASEFMFLVLYNTPTGVIFEFLQLVLLQFAQHFYTITRSNSLLRLWSTNTCKLLKCNAPPMIKRSAAETRWSSDWSDTDCVCVLRSFARHLADIARLGHYCFCMLSTTGVADNVGQHWDSGYMLVYKLYVWLRSADAVR